MKTYQHTYMIDKRYVKDDNAQEAMRETAFANLGREYFKRNANLLKEYVYSNGTEEVTNSGYMGEFYGVWHYLGIRYTYSMEGE